MAMTTIIKRQTLSFAVVVAVLVAILVNPYLAQFSAAIRSHHAQNRIKTSKGLPGSSSSSSSSNNKLSSSSSSPSIGKPDTFVIINFDDSHQSDYTYAKPILDKYGFKATFFEVCNWIETGYHDKDISITWQQIAALQQDGMDIEAHTMTHPNLNGLSQSDLDYEIGQSKQCLENHGFNPTIFA